VKIRDIDRQAALRAIEEMPESFCTKDVSEHADMTSANHLIFREPQYNQVVGMFLSRLTREQDSPIRMEDTRSQKRGQRWRRV